MDGHAARDRRARRAPAADLGRAPRSARCSRVLEVVSDHLGNTPAVCRASYVHPQIVEAFHDGALPERWAQASARGSRLLVPEERKLLHLLRPPPPARWSHAGGSGVTAAQPG